MERIRKREEMIRKCQELQAKGRKELEERDKEEAERRKKLKMEKEIDEESAGLGGSWNWDDNLPF